MRVLLLPKYGEKAASCRYRYLQYLPYLERNGVHCVVSPLFDDAYLENRYRVGRPTIRDVLFSLLRRIAAVARSGRFDLVVLHVEAFPFLPPFFELYMKKTGVKYVFDYDDAIFHNYDLHKSSLVRFCLGNKIATAISGAKAVIAGNRYLADYAEKLNDRVAIVPTVVDLEKYTYAAKESAAGDPFTIGWIGSPSTALYLEDLVPALRVLCAEGNCRIRLVGAGEVSLPGVDHQVIPWSEESEVAELQLFDVGIMPLPDTPWARGKCGFKLIQYMACGIPVVASPVGVNSEIVEPGKDGFLATSCEQWVAALRMLRDDWELRRSMGKQGRKKAKQYYSLQSAAPKVLSVLREAASADVRFIRRVNETGK